MNRTESKKKTEWRIINEDQDKMRVEYGFTQIEKQEPYFSITARVKDRYGEDVAFGCMHEAIKEFFPELTELIPWHLVDCTGCPSHYFANARYWFEKHLGIYKLFSWSKPEGRLPGEPDPLEAFKSTILYGQLPSDVRLKSILENISEQDYNWEKVQNLLSVRLLVLKAKMPEVMEKFEVEYI